MIRPAFCLLCSSRLTCYLHIQISENLLGRSVFYNLSHTKLYIVPSTVVYIYVWTYLWCKLGNYIAIPILYIVKKTEFKYITSIGNRTYIPCKLYICKKVCSLSYGGLLGKFIWNNRFGFYKLNSGFMIKPEKRCIFCNSLKSQTCAILIIFSSWKPMSYFSKVIVARVLYGSYHVKISVISREYPTFYRRACNIIPTRTFYKFCRWYYLFFKSGNGTDRLKCRTGSFLGLSGVVIHREGLILIQWIIIFHIHNICKSVIVITGVGYQSLYLTCIGVGYNNSGSTGVKCKLCRCQLNISDLIYEKQISIVGITCTQVLPLQLIRCQNSLFIKSKAQLISA